jgi:hypothetical protein
MVTADSPVNVRDAGKLGSQPLVIQPLRGDLSRFPTLLAEPPCQALRNYQLYRGAELPGCDTHILQACQRLDGAVGMQRGKDQVSCLGCLDGDFCCLAVSHLAHHDHIGILAQKCP